MIGPLGTNFSEILFVIYKFSFKKMHLKMSSGKWRPSCLGPNVLIYIHLYVFILYSNSVYRTYTYIHKECRSVLVKLHPITVYRTGFGECAVPVFMALDLLSGYRIQHGTMGPLYVASRYSTRIFTGKFQALPLTVVVAFGVVD